MEDLSDKLLDDPSYHPVLQAHFDQAYARNPQGFHEALVAIRDQMGIYLARCWDRLDGDDLTYAGVGDLLMEVDRELSSGMFQRAIETNFRMRGIGSVQVGPQLEELEETSHAASLRTFVPDF